jgi:hypothetical protein
VKILRYFVTLLYIPTAKPVNIFIQISIFSIMQYIYENFTFPPEQSFTVRSEILEVKMYTSLKSHVNFEIALLENCSGKRFVGDHIEDFEGTELVLLGSYLPHCWQYYSALDERLNPQATVVHFFPDFLGKDLLEKPEAVPLKHLFTNAAKGILFSGPTVFRAKNILNQMLFETGLIQLQILPAGAGNKVIWNILKILKTDGAMTSWMRYGIRLLPVPTT